jgi:hypothetical protein
MAGVDVRFRGVFAYVEGRSGGGGYMRRSVGSPEETFDQLSELMSIDPDD